MYVPNSHTHTHTRYTSSWYRDYEARIAQLQEQFGREQADRERLQQELDQLQIDWDDQLNEAQVTLDNQMNCNYTYTINVQAGAVLMSLGMFRFTKVL